MKGVPPTYKTELQMRVEALEELFLMQSRQIELLEEEISKLKGDLVQ